LYWSCSKILQLIGLRRQSPALSVQMVQGAAVKVGCRKIWPTFHRLQFYYWLLLLPAPIELRLKEYATGALGVPTQLHTEAKLKSGPLIDLWRGNQRNSKDSMRTEGSTLCVCQGVCAMVQCVEKPKCHATGNHNLRYSCMLSKQQICQTHDEACCLDCSSWKQE